MDTDNIVYTIYNGSITDYHLTAATIRQAQIEGLVEELTRLKEENQTLKEWIKGRAYSAR